MYKQAKSFRYWEWPILLRLFCLFPSGRSPVEWKLEDSPNPLEYRQPLERMLETWWPAEKLIQERSVEEEELPFGTSAVESYLVERSKSVAGCRLAFVVDWWRSYNQKDSFLSVAVGDWKTEFVVRSDCATTDFELLGQLHELASIPGKIPAETEKDWPHPCGILEKFAEKRRRRIVGYSENQTLHQRCSEKYDLFYA